MEKKIPRIILDILIISRTEIISSKKGVHTVYTQIKLTA